MKLTSCERVTIGDRIRKRRIALSLNQAQLGLKCGWEGEHNAKNRISQYENGGRIPNGEDLCILANALKVTAEWLIFGRESIYANKEGSVPVLHLQDAINYINTNEHNTRFLETFLSELGGNSMKSFYVIAEGDEMVRDPNNKTPFSVHHGDLVLVRPDLEPKNGDFVLMKDSADVCRILLYMAGGGFTGYRSFLENSRPIYYSQKNKVLGVITLIISPLKSKMEELAQTKVIA